MKAYYQTERGTLYQGDCLEVMKQLEANSVDSIVTDPPYGLSFMGKDWDHGVPGVPFWVEALRVAKPGAHLLAFGGTRTFHRLAVAIEDAGWEIRDTIMWVYSQGFPKGLNVAWELHKKACISCGIMVKHDNEEIKPYHRTDEKTASNTAGAEQKTKYGLRFVRATYLQTPVYACAQCGQVLQPFMSEQEAQELRATWSKSEVIWPEQPGMEWRSNMETPEGELQGCPICQMSHRILADGAEGWIHHGASACAGKIPWQVANKDGSRPSYRPQSIEQYTIQPYAFHIERTAQTYRGYNVALKPAWEPIIVARKPLEGTVAENVLKWGTGGINVDGGRVPGRKPQVMQGVNSNASSFNVAKRHQISGDSDEGRFPANLIHDGSEEVVGLFPVTRARGNVTAKRMPGTAFFGNADSVEMGNPGDSGSAARFFYCAKASRSERDKGLDSTRIVKYNVPINKGGALCKDVSTVLAKSLQKATSESTVKWLIGESGESIMGLCPSASLSTTLTEISKITPSQILRLLPPLIISEFIQDARCEAGNGGSLAESVERLNELRQNTTSENQESVLGVNRVVLEMLSTIKDEENWKPFTNSHATVKPLSLMRYLVKLVTPPGGTVLDPFTGSGSTLVACRNLGVQFIGIELNPEYCAMAQARIEPIAAQGRLF